MLAPFAFWLQTPGIWSALPHLPLQPSEFPYNLRTVSSLHLIPFCVLMVDYLLWPDIWLNLLNWIYLSDRAFNGFKILYFQNTRAKSQVQILVINLFKLVSNTLYENPITGCLAVCIIYCYFNTTGSFRKKTSDTKDITDIIIFHLILSARRYIFRDKDLYKGGDIVW
jgi:hypothetical protein